MDAKDVRQLRKKLKLTQSEFAEELSVSVRTLQQWEQGRRSPNEAVIKLYLLAAFGGRGARTTPHEKHPDYVAAMRLVQDAKKRLQPFADALKKGTKLSEKDLNRTLDLNQQFGRAINNALKVHQRITKRTKGKV